MKKYYRVFADEGISAVVLCENERYALAEARAMPKFLDAGVINVRLANLREIEAESLADWNAGKPTASPLALAQARGEL